MPEDTSDNAIRAQYKSVLSDNIEMNLEDRDRRGYTAYPQLREEYCVWEDIATWPDPEPFAP